MIGRKICESQITNSSKKIVEAILTHEDVCRNRQREQGDNKSQIPNCVLWTLNNYIDSDFYASYQLIFNQLSIVSFLSKSQNPLMRSKYKKAKTFGYGLQISENIAEK